MATESVFYKGYEFKPNYMGHWSIYAPGQTQTTDMKSSVKDCKRWVDEKIKKGDK